MHVRAIPNRAFEMLRPITALGNCRTLKNAHIVEKFLAL